jgi:hypothetical protein
MATIDKDGELDAGGAAKVGESVHGGTNAPSGIENVVHQNETPAVDIDRHLSSLETRLQFERRDVIAVETYVELADRDGVALEFADGFGETISDWDAARVHSHESDPRRSVVTFDDLVGDAAYGASDVLRVQDDVPIEGGSFGQRKTPTPEREGKGTLGPMRLWPLVEAGTLSLLGGLTGPL